MYIIIGLYTRKIDVFLKIQELTKVLQDINIQGFIYLRWSYKKKKHYRFLASDFTLKIYLKYFYHKICFSGDASVD